MAVWLLQRVEAARASANSFLHSLVRANSFHVRTYPIKLTRPQQAGAGAFSIIPTGMKNVMPQLYHAVREHRRAQRVLFKTQRPLSPP